MKYSINDILAELRRPVTEGNKQEIEKALKQSEKYKGKIKCDFSGNMKPLEGDLDEIIEEIIRLTGCEDTRQIALKDEGALSSEGQPQQNAVEIVAEEPIEDVENVEVENKEEENKEEDNKEEDKDSLYEEALKKFEKKTSKSYRAGIAELESLGEWKDATEVVEERKTELLEIEAEEKKKKRKLIKRVIISASAVVAVIIGFVIVNEIMRPDLADYTATEDTELNSMSYKIPKECKLETSEKDSYVLYSLSENSKIVGTIEIEYKGDSDLQGDAGYDSESDEHLMSDRVSELLPEASGLYRGIEADNSYYEVTIYSDEKKVEGAETLLDEIVDSFDVEAYSNPRKSKGIEAEYVGDDSAGVKIEEGDEDLSVTETFKTSKGTGWKDVSYTIETPVTLKAGKTSKLKINASGQTCTLAIECSDYVFYENGSFTASLDDIMADYKENYSSIHLSSGSTLAGGKVNIRKIDDTYGGMFTCKATDNSFVITFSGADGSERTQDTDEIPNDLLMLITAEGVDLEQEDLLCMCALFGNMLANINPNIDQEKACEEVLDAFGDAAGGSVKTITREYKGITYTLAYAGSLMTMKIEG